MIATLAPPARDIWTRAALAAGAAHLLAVGALFVRIVPGYDPSNDPPVIAVEMAMPSTLPAPIHDAPTPRQVEAPEQTPPKPVAQKKLPFDPPPEQPIASIKPDVVLPPKREETRPIEKADPLPPAPTTTELSAPELKPDTKVAAQITGGAAAGKPTAADMWDARVLARIELMKRYPGAASRENQQDQVRVLVAMDRGGRLLDARIASSRGFDLLDEAALDAVRRAAPFPKPPPEIAGNQVRVAVIVRFFRKAR